MPCSWSRSSASPGWASRRLVREFAGLVDAQPELVTWRQGHCLPYGEAVGFWALGEIVKAQAGILDSDDRAGGSRRSSTPRPRRRRRRLGARVAKARLAPLVGLATAAEAPAGRDESFMAWRRFLQLVATQGPLVLVVEDLHWADPALLDFLEQLLDRRARPICSWWSRPGRSCSTGAPAGGPGSRMRRPCPWPPSTTRRPRCCSPPCSGGRCCRRRCSRCSWNVRAATPCTPRSSCACSPTGGCSNRTATWRARPTCRCRTRCRP